MKTTLATTIVVLGTMLAPVAVFAADSDSDRTHPLTFVKDSAITIKVKAKLADEKMSSLAKVSVDTDDHGVVVLKGNVRTQEQADKAGEIARGTEGVTSVRNNIQVKKDD